MTWINDTRLALKNLDKPSHLNEIYSEIENIRDISSSKSWKAVTRRVLETNSFDSKVFDSKFNFFGNKNIGEGIWYLQENPLEIMQLGREYSRTEIGLILEEENLGREGIFYSKSHNITILFTDLEKGMGSIKYNDFFEKDFFHWDSQTIQHINTPRIKEIANKERDVILFCRVNQKIKSKTQPYIYCGRLIYEEYEEGTSNPVHIIFRSESYSDEGFDDAELRKIWNWKSNKKDTRIEKSNQISKERKRNYKKPTTTERIGLTISRVGQGYYRREVLDRWENKCAVKEITLEKILIASHIVPWKDSNEEERLDVGNGILLSPNIDALFDRNIISFSNEGNILISQQLNEEDYKNLGISKNSQLRKVYKDMFKYLERHRKLFYDKEE
jgi:hypothetical protein|tara:strand:- start:1018 stop:2178 length:1161 start_codon:yes stop_codon:yes gene_type:complete